MSNIEKIKAEIERLKVDYLYRGYTFVPTAMQQLLNFIDSLPEEKPSDDLEEAAEKYAHCPFTDDDGNFHEDAIDETAYRDFIAGAEWQKKHDAELIEIAYNDGITIGKTKQKEQMMKEAVEGFIFQSEDYYPKELVAQYNGELKHGDKVKIIIVNDDPEKILEEYNRICDTSKVTRR